MQRDFQRLFEHIQFLGFVTVLEIQIIEIVIVKLNSNGCQHASCALGVHGRSRVLLFEFQYIYIYTYIYSPLLKKNHH